jgi:hypothetical protein
MALTTGAAAALQSEHRRLANAAVGIDSSAGASTSNSGSDHNTNRCTDSRCKTTSLDSSSEGQHNSSLSNRLLALQAQRVVAARQHAATTAATAATAAAVVAEADARVSRLQVDSKTAGIDEAALVAAAEAAAVTAIEAYSSHSLACKLLQIEL